jgi:hypothetical protein
MVYCYIFETGNISAEVKPLKVFPVFYGTGRFITVFRRALHWSLS